MLVVRVFLWPGGDRAKERLLTQATIDLQNVGDDGERSYRVQLLKDTSFGGPEVEADVHPGVLPVRQVWRKGFVRGHFPATGSAPLNQRGTWDLLGGALKVLLGRRLDSYKALEGR